MSELARLPSLAGLGLESTQVTSHGLRALANCNLQELILDDLKLSDDDADTLAEIGTLTSLSLANTGISPEAVNRLRKKLPNCDVRL